MGVKVYQSAKQQSIVVTGTGFAEGIKYVAFSATVSLMFFIIFSIHTRRFEFEPAIQQGVDYEMVVNNKNKITLSLKQGKKWRSDAGFIIAKKVCCVCIPVRV